MKNEGGEDEVVLSRGGKEEKKQVDIEGKEKERKEEEGRKRREIRSFEIWIIRFCLQRDRSIDRSLIHFLLCPIVRENYVAQIQLRINASFLYPIVPTFSTIFLRHVWIRRVALLLRIHWPFDKPFVPPFSSEITALFPFLNGFCQNWIVRDSWNYEAGEIVFPSKLSARWITYFGSLEGLNLIMILNIVQGILPM